MLKDRPRNKKLNLFREIKLLLCCIRRTYYSSFRTAISIFLKRFNSSFLIGGISLFNSLTIATSNTINTTVQDNADMSEAVSNASKPPVKRSSAETNDTSATQTTFINNGGCKLPFAVMLAKIYGAESADVTKNVKINKSATIDKNVVKGK